MSTPFIALRISTGLRKEEVEVEVICATEEKGSNN